MARAAKKMSLKVARVTKVQFGTQLADTAAFSRLSQHPDLAAGRHGIPMRASVPGGEIIQLSQADGVSILIQPLRVNVAVEIPEDFQSSFVDAWGYFKRRTAKTLGLIKSAGASRVPWAGVIATFFREDPAAKSAADAANRWALAKSLPFVADDTLSHFSYSIGYSRVGINEIVQIQGSDVRAVLVSPGTASLPLPSSPATIAGLEFNVDYNDRPLSKVDELSKKLDALSKRLISSAQKWID